MKIELKTINNSRYITVEGEVIIFTDYIPEKYEVFFMPTNKKDFEYVTDLKFEEGKFFPFAPFEDDYYFEYLVEITSNMFIDLAILCEGKEMIKIPNEVDFKHKFMQSIKANIESLKEFITTSNVNARNIFKTQLEYNKVLLEFVERNL